MMSRKSYWNAVGTAVALLAAPALAETVAGPAEVVDGDSLVVAGHRIRLVGIDAPEYDQTCTRAGQRWACGSEAKAQLASLISGHRVECIGAEWDAHARLLAVCSVGYLELNQALVAGGWAVAYRTYSDAYVSDEIHAKTARLGIWDSAFETPAEFRQRKLPPAQAMAPNIRRPAPLGGRVGPFANGCVIKGNRNRRGQWIYHLPGMPYYDQTRAEEIFCTEEQAQRAGYRRAIVRP